VIPSKPLKQIGIRAKAGIHAAVKEKWIPACAVMTQYSNLAASRRVRNIT